MATFVHLTVESQLKTLRTTGIAASRIGCERGVYAMPVTANFQISHQWLRELRLRQGGQIFAVYVRIRDDEVITAGRYNKPHAQMSAAQAITLFMQEETAGFEVIVGRRILPKEILRIKALPQAIGWRYFPEAKGKRPYCCCPYCQRGQRNGRKLMVRWAQENS